MQQLILAKQHSWSSRLQKQCGMLESSIVYVKTVPTSYLEINIHRGSMFWLHLVASPKLKTKQKTRHTLLRQYKNWQFASGQAIWYLSNMPYISISLKSESSATRHIQMTADRHGLSNVFNSQASHGMEFLKNFK